MATSPTVVLESIRFADKAVPVTIETSPPVGKKEFNAEVPMPEKSLTVLVHVSVDMLTGELTYHMIARDQFGNVPPADPNAGFLDGGQEGSLLFSVQPKSTVPTGTAITNQASIIFDTQDPIPTPQWFNTIDSNKPVSQVYPLMPLQNTTSFDVRWAGDDVGSGLKDFTIYVSDNDGPFVPWLTSTADTHATFTGEPHHVYRFYSAARDNVFNVEAAHALPDAFTRVVPSVKSSPRKRGGSIGTSRPHGR